MAGARSKFVLSFWATLSIAAAGAITPGERAPVFHRDIVPILQAHCQSCHRPGEVAPTSFLTYAQVRPWAKAIKAAVLTGKMPPWLADPAYGCFSNDARLKPAEVQALVDWANSGAREGNPKDAPAPLQFSDGWSLKPDIVIALPKPVPIPANGPINYKYVVVKTNFPRDLWVSVSEMRPGNRRVLHHGKVWVRPPGSRWMADAIPGEPYEYEVHRDRIGRNLMADGNEVVGKYNPGLGVQHYDASGSDAGVLVPKGSDLVFEMHYTPIGEPASDQSRVGLVVRNQPPLQRYHYSIRLATPAMRIPPRVANFEVVSEVTVDAPARLVYIQPHMHLRGKDYELRIVYPGREATPVTVFKSKYDFNWQLGYVLAKPVQLPVGARLIGIAHYDNSVNNPANPDPNQEVRWGPQNNDEMSNGFLGLLIDPATPASAVLRRTGPSAPTPLIRFWQLVSGGVEQ